MTFRYIGSKARLADVISAHIGRPSGSGWFVDAFCGTGAVAEVAARLGWSVRLNDHLLSSVTIAAARLIGSEDVLFRKFGGYNGALTRLNELPPINGFVWREYSPASKTFIGIERRYFSEINAGRIDAMRVKIQVWKEAGDVSELEERLLLADLLGGANSVANIAGTYGCFLSKWQAQALNDLQLRPRLLRCRHASVEVSVADASKVAMSSGDLVYLDPPYTKRQYAAYYHVLETIAAGDEPPVEGVAGIRPWKSKASDFCYKRRALNAIATLIERIPATRVLLSYSDEAHVPIHSLTAALSQLGTVTPHRLMEVGRYRPNRTASQAGASVGEYLIMVDRKMAKVAA